MLRLGFLTIAIWVFLADLALAAQKRVALVIGNAAYTGTASLENPVNDATAIAAALTDLGFDAHLVADATAEGTAEQVSAFTRALNGADIAVFFFAGHGIQVGGQNYLLPTDVSLDTEWALKHSALNVQDLLREMEARAEASIVILDACRDNPFPDQLGGGTRSTAVNRGLGLMNLEGKGAIVAYAAAAGRVASDGDGPHSPYTQALLAEMSAPGVEVGLMLRRVVGRVIDATNGQQRPELLVRLIDEVYLNKTPDLATPLIDVPSPKDTQMASVARSTNGPVAETRTRSFFGDTPVVPPDWVKGLEVPAPTGYESAPVTAIVDAAPGHNLSRAMALPLAAAVETRIVERGQKPWYKVSVQVAGHIHILIPETPPEIDIYARVWNADRDVVADWRGAAAPGGALDELYPVPGPGDYWIELSDGNSNAASVTPFTMSVDFRPADDPLEPNNSLGTARPVPSTASFRPAIFPRGDRDWYQFWIDRPGLFSAEATRVPQNLDIFIRVRDFNGNVVRDWVGPAREGGDTYIEAELGAPGRYFIEMSDGNSNAASTDAFRLDLTFEPVDDAMEPNGSFGQASLQERSGTHQIAIFPRGDRDWVAIDVDESGQLDLEVTDVPDELDIYMRVWNANKDVLRDWFGPPRPGGDTYDYADLPRPGRYFIEIADGNNNASDAQSFPLTLNFTPQPDKFEPNNNFIEATPLTAGGEIAFNILPRGDEDWFKIEVPSAGELTAIIDPSPENLDLHYRVWNANHDVIRDWIPPYRQGGVTEGYADFPSAGTYFLQISDGGSNARAIEHAVLKTGFIATNDPTEPNNSFGTAKPIVIGAPHTGYILPRGDVDWLRLELDRPGSLEIEIDDVDEALDVSFRLWTENRDAGSWFVPARPGGPVYATIPITEPGAYRLEIADGGGNARSANGFTVTVSFE